MNRNSAMGEKVGVGAFSRLQDEMHLEFEDKEFY